MTRSHGILASSLATLLPTLLAACNVIGPRALVEGRATYNTVINQTEDEQILAMLVRQRYDETFGMLAVASVTASIRAGATVGTNVGIGPDRNYEGNLVPFSAEATYEENPTISYTPLRGEQFVEHMLAPITLDQALLLTRASTDDVEVLRLVVRRANGLVNPLFAPDRANASFGRFVDLYVSLREAGKLDLVRTAQGDYQLLLHDFESEDADRVRELLATLGIAGGPADQTRILLPLTFSVGAPRQDGLDLETPSVLEVIRAAAMGVEIPAEHVAAGIARPAAEPAPDPAASLVTIHASASRPDQASVTVEHRGWWFSIDARDTRSKQAFLILRTLIGMRLDQSPATQQVPVLTVPVAR